MFDNLEENTTQESKNDFKKKEEINDTGKVQNTPEMKYVEETKSAPEIKKEDPDDMFSFVDKNEKVDIKEKKGDVTLDETGKEDPNSSLISVFAIDSLVKFLIYAIISLIAISSLSLWISSLLT